MFSRMNRSLFHFIRFIFIAYSIRFIFNQSIQTHPITTINTIRISDQDPHHVWTFISELKHKRLTDPTLSNIQIIEDTVPIYPHSWAYKAILSEKVPTLGDVDIEANYQISSPIHGNYTIDSSMQFCKYFNCVNAKSALTFISKESSSDAKSMDTLLEESIVIHVPRILLWLIGKEAIQEAFTSKLEHIQHYFHNQASQASRVHN